MKKVFVLLLAVFMCACTHTIKDSAKVVKIEYSDSDYTYKITVSNCDYNAPTNGCLHILTNHKYSIGDTVHIVKK